MELYGTQTSPFVRMVRVHAHRMGVDVKLVSTAGDPGEQLVRNVSPVWKVPFAVVDGHALADSRVMIAHLWRRHGAIAQRGGMRPYGFELGEVVEDNLCAVIHGILDAAVNVFLATRDGTPPNAYAAKQKERMAHGLAWLASQMHGTSFTQDARVGTAEVTLACALEWMVFRKQLDVAAVAPLQAFCQAHQADPFMAETAPG